MQSFTIKEALSFGWLKYKEHWKFLVPLFIVMAVLYAFVSYTQPLDDISMSIVALQFLGNIIVAYLSIGIMNVMLRIYRAEPIEIKNLFLSWNIFWKSMIGSILVSLTVLAGFILLVIPGLVWWITYSFYFYFIVEKGAGPVDAMKMSRKITVGERWHILGCFLIVILTNLVGAIVIGIGLFVSVPVSMLMLVYVYKKLSEKKLENIVSESVSQAMSA